MAENTKRLDEQETKIKGLEDLLEDQINRNRRNSLVIKGIPELENVFWEQTKHTVGKLLGPLLNENPKNIIEGIERAHRGGEKRQQAQEHLLAILLFRKR